MQRRAMNYGFVLMLLGALAGVFVGMASAQPAIVPGQSGVYVEQYANGNWSKVSGFPNRYRLDSQGNPDPEPGLSGNDLDLVQFGTIAGRYYSIFASNNASSTNIGDIKSCLRRYPRRGHQ